MKERKNEERLYNVLFPIWFFWLWPSRLWLLILPANFVIDSVVLLLALRHRGLRERLSVWRRSILPIWVIGFLSDFVGAALIYGLVCLMDRIAPNFNCLLFPGTTLISLPGVLLAGLLIYGLNRKFSFRNCIQETAEVRRLCLILAVVTAPYAMMIPLYG